MGRKRKARPEAPELLHETLGDLVTSERRVDLQRLEREFGVAVASEVVRHMIRRRAEQKKRR